MDEILTLQELQEYLKIPKPTLYQLAQRGRIPAAKVGRHWRFQRRSIEQWLKAQERGRKQGVEREPVASDLPQLTEVTAAAS